MNLKRGDVQANIVHLSSFLPSVQHGFHLFDFRSSDDDYCPKSQVEDIQHQMLSVLKDIYQDIQTVHKYQDCPEKEEIDNKDDKK